MKKLLLSISAFSLSFGVLNAAQSELQDNSEGITSGLGANVPNQAPSAMSTDFNNRFGSMFSPVPEEQKKDPFAEVVANLVVEEDAKASEVQPTDVVTLDSVLAKKKKNPLDSEAVQQKEASLMTEGSSSFESNTGAEAAKTSESDSSLADPNPSANETGEKTPESLETTQPSDAAVEAPAAVDEVKVDVAADAAVEAPAAVDEVKVDVAADAAVEAPAAVDEVKVDVAADAAVEAPAAVDEVKVDVAADAATEENDGDAATEENDGDVAA